MLLFVFLSDLKKKKPNSEISGNPFQSPVSRDTMSKPAYKVADIKLADFGRKEIIMAG